MQADCHTVLPDEQHFLRFKAAAAKRFAMTDRLLPRGTKRSPCWPDISSPRGTKRSPCWPDISSPRCPKGHRMKRRGPPAGLTFRHREGRSAFPAGMQADSTRDASLCHTVLPDEQYFLRFKAAAAKRFAATAMKVKRNQVSTFRFSATLHSEWSIAYAYKRP